LNNRESTGIYRQTEQHQKHQFFMVRLETAIFTREELARTATAF